MTDGDVKRKRGRPRKFPLSESVPNIGSPNRKQASSDKNIGSSTNNTSKTETSQRLQKKRGRKRKMKVDSDEYETEQEDSNNHEKSRVWELVQPQFLTLVIQALSIILLHLIVFFKYLCIGINFSFVYSYISSEVMK